MNTFAPMMIVYLFGVATPIFLVSLIPAIADDKGGRCLLNLILLGIGLLILWCVYIWPQ